MTDKLAHDPRSRYWATYATRDEASQSPKQRWTDATLSAGIVNSAIQLLQECVDPSLAPATTWECSPEGVWTLGQLVVWNGLRVQIVGVSATDAVSAKALVVELRNRAREALCFCVVPGVFSEAEAEIEGEANWLSTGTVFVYPDDLDALALNYWTLIELVEYKLFRSQVLEKPAPETQYDRRLVAEFHNNTPRQQSPFLPVSDVLANYPDDHRRWAKHPLGERVERALTNGRSCLLIGPSSSGKTVMALQTAERSAIGGASVRYINLGTIAGSFQPSFREVVCATTDLRRLYVVDDLQSNPQIARYLANLINLSRRASIQLPNLLIAVSWPDFAESAASFIEDCLPIYVRAKDVRQSVISIYSLGDGSDLSGEAFEAVKDDLQLLRIFLEARDEGVGAKESSSSLQDVAASYWARRTSALDLSTSDAMRAVLTVATLGRYDVLVPRSFVKKEAHVDMAVIDSLVRTSLLRVSRDLLTVGHRSLAALLSDWLARTGAWAEIQSHGGPEDPFGLVRDYLRTASPDLALETLRALQARAGFKASTKLNSRTAALVATWRAFNALLERIRHQQSIDPQWGSIPSSIMFVVQSFAEIGRQEDARASMRFLRSKYRVDGTGALRMDAATLATRKDFELIASAMQKQDAHYGEEKLNLPASWTPAAAVDIERFHCTWLSGVVLCAEAAFQGAPDTDLDDLADAVGREQLSSGAFYPERAVWPTARVCLGLAAAGRSVHSDPVIKRAIDWLLTSRDLGGPSDGGLWRTGTGEWNSDLEVTAMALLACLASGIDPEDRRLVPAKRYLISQSEQWTIPGRELEGAVAAQAYLEAGGAWDEIFGQVQRLTEWAQGEAFWRTATHTSTESFEQSCRVAQTAFHLLAIGWSAIRSELPLLLQALEMPEGLWRVSTQVAQRSGTVPSAPSGTAQQKELPAVSAPVQEHASVVASLRGLDSLRVEDLSVVGNYCRFDERTRNQLKDWRIRISRNFADKTCSHENFLIWAAPGSGKSFFVTEIAATLETNGVSLVTLNLAKDSQEDFQSRLDDLGRSGKSVLCLVDEIDARRDETWPYELLFSHLDRNLLPDHQFVFVLIGSSRAGMNGMVQEMLLRSKGPDLLDRVPIDRRFEVPPMSLEDRAVIFSSNVREAARTKGQTVRQIEKFALFYILVKAELNSPRQLRDLAYSAVGRVSAADDRLHYDNLFAVGERKNQQFWGQHQGAANQLADMYVSL